MRTGLREAFEARGEDVPQVVLPLSGFRWDFRRTPGRFSGVGRLLIQWDSGEGTVYIDDLMLLPGERGPLSCRPTAGEQLALAFPEGDGRAIPGAHFLILTNVPDLTAERAAPILDRLEAGLALLRGRYRLPGDPDDPAPLCIFTTDGEYRAFFERIGRHYRAGIEPPDADGYTALGYAATTWDPAQGTGRPVFVHEAMHAAILRILHLGSTGDWIHEALASAIQFRLHPDSMKLDLAQAFESRSRGEGPFEPLSLLLTRKRPGLSRYPELLAFVEYLAEEHAERLPAFWDRVAGSWKLPHESGLPALEAALRWPIERIGAAWLDWGSKRDG